MKVSGWEGDEQEISTPGALAENIPMRERKGEKTGFTATKYIVDHHHHHSSEWMKSMKVYLTKLLQKGKLFFLEIFWNGDR